MAVDEVKILANQPAGATDDFTGQVGAIQNAVDHVAIAIRTVKQIMGSINDASAAIASSMTEQSSAPDEIARNVEQASAGASEVAWNVADLRQAMGEIDQSTQALMEATRELEAQSDHLGTELGSFLRELKWSDPIRLFQPNSEFSTRISHSRQPNRLFAASQGRFGPLH